MATRTVWAYKRIAELGYELAFVQCEESLAAQLIESGEAQDCNLGTQQKPINFSWPPATKRTPDPHPTGKDKHTEKLPRDKKHDAGGRE